MGSGVTTESGTSLSLLQRIRNGDASGWRRVVDLYTPLVSYWCRRWGVDGADAEDVIQEVFKAAAQSIGAFRRENAGDTFRGWLRVIARHRVLAFWRERDRQPEAPGGSEALRRLESIAEPAASEPIDAEEADQFSDLVRRALSLLRGEFEPRTWDAFWHVTVDGRPTADVGADLGMSANAVRMAKSRVMRRLREELGDLVQ
jgi:RNA polymerase sigma-70 factor, ECF subfamily